MSDFKGPLFIVGMPRSGTKLLRDILNNHHKIAISNAETEILPYWSEHWSEYGDLNDFSVFQRFYESTRNNSFFYYMEKHNGKVISAKEWHRLCKDGSIPSVFEALIRLDTHCTSEIIWGDKSPSYICHIPLLVRLFPDCKIIHIVRDVRDYCLSINNAWGKNMLRAAQRWADDVEKAKIAVAGNEDRVMEVRYEDLLDNPHDFLQKISNFIGIDFKEDMLFLNRTRGKDIDTEGAREVVVTNKEKWRTKLSPITIRKIEELCSTTLNYYNYPMTYQGAVKRIHPIKMTLLKFLDGFNLVFHDTQKQGFFKSTIFYLRYVKYTKIRQKF